MGQRTFSALRSGQRTDALPGLPHATPRSRAKAGATGCVCLWLRGADRSPRPLWSISPFRQRTWKTWQDMSASARAKLGEQRRGKPLTPAHRAKISAVCARAPSGSGRPPHRKAHRALLEVLPRISLRQSLIEGADVEARDQLRGHLVPLERRRHRGVGRRRTEYGDTIVCM